MYVHTYVLKISRIFEDRNRSRLKTKSEPSQQILLKHATCFLLSPIREADPSLRVRLDKFMYIEQPVSRGTRQAGKNVGRQTFPRDTRKADCGCTLEVRQQPEEEQEVPTKP